MKHGLILIKPQEWFGQTIQQNVLKETVKRKKGYYHDDMNAANSFQKVVCKYVDT